MILGISIVQFVLLLLFLIFFTLSGSGAIAWAQSLTQNICKKDWKGVVLSVLAGISGFAIGFILSLSLKELHSVAFGVLMGISGIAGMQAAYKMVFGRDNSAYDEVYAAGVEAIKNKLQK
jgi:hypothetical protein